MKKCNKCGAQLIDEAVFCTNCGASLEDNLEETGLLYDDNELNTTVLDDDDEMNTSVLDEDIEKIPSINEVNPFIYAEPIEKPAQDVVPTQYVNPMYQGNNNIQGRPQQNYYNPVQHQTNVNIQNNIQGEKMSYDEFYEKFASKKAKNNAKTVGIICIITAVISLGILGATTNPLAVIDIVFYGVFAGLVLKKKKWVFTLPVCIYGGVFTIIGLAISGTPSGIFAFIISIIATISLKKVDDAYKKYLATNQLPQNEI